MVCNSATENCDLLKTYDFRYSTATFNTAVILCL